MTARDLTKYIWLSIAAAVATISLKSIAYLATGSVSLFSDAIESLINLAAAVFALWMLKVAARPPDDDHHYGHTKAEYFSGAVEGALIAAAALSIAWAAVMRLFDLQPLENVGIGLVVSAVASVINLVVGLILMKKGRDARSITLEADGHHLMTDVYTSAGVIVGVIAVQATGWLILDPLIAIAVAVNILHSGYKIIRAAAAGLMDAASPPEDLAKIIGIFEQYRQSHGIDYHALRTRLSGARTFVSAHLLVPDEWTVAKGHDLAEEIENAIRDAVPGSVATTHLEPLNDPASMNDIDII